MSSSNSVWASPCGVAVKNEATIHDRTTSKDTAQRTRNHMTAWCTLVDLLLRSSNTEPDILHSHPPSPHVQAATAWIRKCRVKYDQALLVLLTIVLISEARYCTQPSKKWHKVQNSCTSLLRLLQNAHRVAVVFLTRSDNFNETVHVPSQYKQGPRALKMCVDG